MLFKEINIGNLIQEKVTECGIPSSRICNFFKLSEDEITSMYKQENLESNLILKWSKLLEYDFFRIYSQHLILYSPPKAIEPTSKKHKSILPEFRKNIYSIEIIIFILKQINTGKMSKQDVITDYNIPKTTLYKWIKKYNVDSKNTNDEHSKL